MSTGASTGVRKAAPASGAGLVLAVAFLAGACTMAVELAAVRLLAPWFGTSSAVWTNVIGVVLLALSIGYLAGARASGGERPARTLALVLGGGAMCAAILPALSAPVARFFLPEKLALDEAADLVQWGSLAASACLFLPPAALLGFVSPLCCEVLERRQQSSAGRAGGMVLCASTLGSLLGTFGTTYVLVPEIGLKWTFTGAGILLALLALFVLRAIKTPPERARVTIALLAVLGACIGLGAAGPRAGTPGLQPGWTLLDAAESTYQSVRVVESRDGGKVMRHLQVNESFDSFQSVWQPEKGFLPDGYYYNAFAYPLWWSRDVRDWRVAVVGLGAGTAWRVLDGSRPKDTTLDLVGVEIDPVVVEMAQRHMDLPVGDPHCRVLSGRDGRAALRELPGGFDLIVLDAYANQMEIPAHLSTREFFAECKDKLSPGGWLVANVGGFGFEDPVVMVVARTLAAAFDARVLAVRLPFSRNVALFARRDAQPPEPGTVAWRTGEAEIDRHLSAVSLPGTWRSVVPPRTQGGMFAATGKWHWLEPWSWDILTDDHAPIEALQRASIAIATARARGEDAP